MEHFLLAFLWIFYFFLHSFFAKTSIKEQVQKKWNFIYKYYRIIYNIFSTSLLLIIISYQDNVKGITLFKASSLSSIIGITLILFGVVISLISFKNYSISEFLGFDFKREVKPVYTLEISGLNKYVRHPLYFATLLIVWGYLFVKPTSTILIMNLVVSLYLIIGTKLEEKKLINEFGEVYKTYIKEVPMLIPKLN